MKRPLQSPSSDKSLDNASPLNIQAVQNFCAILEDYCNLLGGYCSSLEAHGLLGTYKWSEAGEIIAISPYLRAEELMNMIQSREYQVKFCHANIAHHRKNSVESDDKAAKTGCDCGTASNNVGDIERCSNSLGLSPLMSKVIIGFGVITVLLLTITLILVAILVS